MHYITDIYAKPGHAPSITGDGLQHTHKDCGENTVNDVFHGNCIGYTKLPYIFHKRVA